MSRINRQTRGNTTVWNSDEDTWDSIIALWNSGAGIVRWFNKETGEWFEYELGSPLTRS